MSTKSRLLTPTYCHFSKDHSYSGWHSSSYSTHKYFTKEGIKQDFIFRQMRNIWKFFIVCCDSWPSCKLFCMIKVVKSCEVWAINRVVLPLQIQSAITLIVIVSQCPGPEQPWANSTVSCTKTKCQRKTRSPQRIWTLCIANKYRYDSFKLKNCAFIISLFFVQSNPSGDNSIQMDAISTGVWEILQLN